MMDKKDTFPIEEYLDVAIRRKWLIIIPFVVSLIITPLVYWKLPRIYRSESLILIIPQKVPESYVRSTVTTPIDERLRTIAQDILSRTRLEAIINKFNLYAEAREKEPMERIVWQMRKDVRLDVKRNRSFNIFYHGRDPEVVRAVCAKLSSLFVEENIKTREQQAYITSDFLAKELASAKQRLDEQEEAVAKFKTKYMHSLPENRGTNLSMLRELNRQREAVGVSLNNALNQRSLIQQQLSGIQAFIPDHQTLATGSIPSIPSSLQAAKDELARLRVLYTDEHIEVKKAKQRLRILEDQLKENRLNIGTGETQDEATDATEVNPLYGNLKVQLMSVNNEIKQLRAEENRIREQIVAYQKRVEEVPKIEQQLAILTRGYDNVKRHYDNLLTKKMQAEQATNLEKKQQGEQFKIVDPASLPARPFEPNPLKIFGLGLFLGLGGGCGLAFLAEILDKSFRNVKEVEEYLGVPVLASIPVIKEAHRS